MDDALACPRCQSTIAPEGDGLACADCGWGGPLLGGVPIAVPDAAAWCATYRDAALAALAERDRATPDVRRTLDAWAARARGLAPARFTDDWVARERGGARPVPPTSTPLTARLAAWLDDVEADPLEARLAALVGAGRVLEAGCGAAGLTARLVEAGATVWAGDVSLRAALAAEEAGAAPIVLEAAALPAAPEAFDAVVAANLIDLLDEPAALIEAARESLRPGGRLVLSTPDPALGTEDDCLVPLLDELGFAIDDVIDAHPWVRDHHGRHLEVYVVQIVVARKE